MDSVLNKRQELVHIFKIENPDIVLLNELLPKKTTFDVQPAEINFEGYDCFSNCFESSIRNPRGVAIYVKRSLNAQPVILNEDQIVAKETVWAEIKLKDDEKLLIGCIYRPPSNTKQENAKLYSTILDLIGNKSHVLVAGDFNQPDVNWETESAKFQSRNELEPNDACTFLNFFHDTYLFQHVQSPTHFRSDQRPTLIDLILSSEEGMVQNLHQKAPVGKSHHQVLCFDFVCYSQLSHDMNNGIRYNYKKADFVKMRKTMHEYDLTNRIQEKSVQDAWDCIVEAIEFAVDENVPKILPRKNQSHKSSNHHNLNDLAIEKNQS